MKTVLAALILAAASAHADTLTANYGGKLYTYTGTFTELEMQGLDGTATFVPTSRTLVPFGNPSPPLVGSWQVTLIGGKVYFLECFATYSLGGASLDLLCEDDE